jgi:nitronate monooxygenase
MLNKVVELEVPVIQAPMAGVQDADLAIAVCNAGGLGSLAAAMLSRSVLESELRRITSATDRPFNVNFFCHTEPPNDPVRQAAWLRLLEPYYAELGLSQNSISRESKRTPFTHEVADVVEPFRPAVVSFHFGLPGRAVLDRVRHWGSKVLGCATTVDEAIWLAAHGVDGIVAQGLEAGGHRGMFLSSDVASQIGTFALVPQIQSSVSCPVIAAGGIANATGVASAMSLGAAAAQIGTAYLLCSEAKTSSVHRAALKREAARLTALTNVFSGRLARGIVNRLMRDLGYINSTAPEFPLASAALAPLRAAAEALRRDDFSPLWAGQNVSGCKETSAAELTRELGACV